MKKRSKSGRKDLGEHDVIIVLGSPNSEFGELSPIAIGRAKTALAEYRRRAKCKILLTGGHGKHFNLAPNPHAYYMAEFLIGQGVSRSDLLEFAKSTNTKEDAVFSRRILRKINCKSLIVITSGFHLPRARAIFQRVFRGCELFFIEAPAELSITELERLRLHEEDALRRLDAEGIVEED